MSSYELIAFDMDGTLLNSEKKITRPVLDAIAEAEKQGKQVALGTGRSLGELKIYADDLKNIRYWVAESGAAVYDSYNDKFLYRKTFDPQTQQVFAEVAGWPDTDTTLFTMSMGESYIEKRAMKLLDHYNLGVYTETYEACGRLIDEDQDFIASRKEGFEKINIMSDSPETRETVYQRLLALHVPATIAKAEISNLECSPLGTSKATGIKKLCEILNLSTDNVIAVGDADNDLEMLGAVGFPIAMGNGNEHVKAVAKAVVADNDHDGTAEAIYKYLL